MKKFIAVAMIALLAVTSVFAGFAGQFQTSATADFANGKYGFINNSDPALKFTFDATSQSTENEGDVYGKLSAVLAIKDFKGAAGDPTQVAAKFKITEASINGADWSVDLMSQAGVANYAHGWYARYANPWTGATADLNYGVATAPGVTTTVYGYKVGTGLWIDDAGKAFGVSVATPAISLVDGLTIEATAGAGHKAASATTNVGFGLNVAYADDAISASVASDMVLDIIDNADPAFNAEVAAAFGYDFVSANVYYATEAKHVHPNGTVCYGVTENLLDAGVDFDLAGFDVPLALSVYGLDLINDVRNIELGVSSEFVEGAEAHVYAGLGLDMSFWYAQVGGSYAIDKVGTVAADISMDGADSFDTLGLSVSLENTTLVNGATLKVAYNSANFLDEAEAAGALTASATIAF